MISTIQKHWDSRDKRESREELSKLYNYLRHSLNCSYGAIYGIFVEAVPSIVGTGDYDDFMWSLDDAE